MVRQQRATRTRGYLLCAAASAFDRHGYDGTSLARISALAGISMGAVTFHFRTKRELAREVQACGRAVTGAAVDQVTTGAAPALHSVVELTLAVARLLRDEAMVRAAARLTREDPGAGADWTSAWLPAVRVLLQRAHENGELRPEVPIEAAESLIVHLVVGSEALVRTRFAAGNDDDSDGAAQLQVIWQFVLCSIAADACARPGGAGCDAATS